MLEVPAAVVSFGEGGHPDVEVAEIAHQANEFLGVLHAVGMFGPLPQWIARRITAQDEDIGDARSA